MELRNSLVALDVKRIAGAIESIAERDAELGTALTSHADRFAYTPILDALDGAGLRAAGEGHEQL